MKKSVVTLLAVAALGVAAPVFADNFNNPNLDPALVAAVNGDVTETATKDAEAVAKVEAEKAAAKAEAEANKALVEKAVAEQPKTDSVKVGDVLVSSPDKNIVLTEAVDKTGANTPAEAKKEEAKKEEAAKPASKSVAAAATKKAAKALPKTSAVK